MSQANSNVQSSETSLRPWFEKPMAMEPPAAFVHAVSKVNMDTDTPHCFRKCQPNDPGYVNVQVRTSVPKAPCPQLHDMPW